MAKFIYLADTHCGAEAMGYFQQPAYPEQLPALAGLLDGWIARAGDIDFVIHGGDVVDEATSGNVRRAKDVFRLCVPTYVCIGNHDMTAEDTPALWLDEAPELLAGGELNFTITGDRWALHVMPNHWCDQPYYWDDEQDAYFLPEQLLRVESAIAATPRASHVLITHSPVLPVPPEQTGLDAPYHGPNESFTEDVLALAGRQPGLRAIFSAHTHINMHVQHAGAHYVTVSSFVETPFEFKVVEVDASGVKMDTVSLAKAADFEAAYDDEHAYVQGRPEDRAFDDRTV
jgi:3',5'-cyclic AMP phosphodiesterase CpdA